ncbi:protein REVEILLE 6 isoform X1 [Gossypium australe]|uniref:Protein REVEILLE 6 isoform X1 n=1 Tax=Gossypium australe TaxID=47621 RepID=A0A5B6UP51_9ROSI|nr:protein REVEILLE 6 isoform X1 [Gossypium australe]
MTYPFFLQIRSHAQKYFLKVQKNGTNEHLPPPRPKRKAAHPYPQKASKNVHAQPQASGSLQSSNALVDTGCVLRSDPSLMLMNPVTVASSWTHNEQTISFSQAKKGSGMANKSRGSSMSTPQRRQIGEMTNQGNHGHALRGLLLPDFVQVYSFIGSVFDPNSTGHLQKLKKMDPIDIETVLLLMRNLSINLTSPDFEDHRKLLSSYEIDTETIYHGGACKAVDLGFNMALWGLSEGELTRFEQEHSRLGDRFGYRGDPRRGGGDKEGAPADSQPAFRVDFMCYIGLSA